jgi:hypothetical protein
VVLRKSSERRPAHVVDVAADEARREGLNFADYWRGVAGRDGVKAFLKVSR